MRSSIPLVGLVHEVDVVRRRDADDGFGGVVAGGEEVEVYSELACRITVMSDQDEQEMFGSASGRHWKVIADHAPNLQRSDFICVPWGTQPNIASPTGLAEDFPWSFVVDTPAGEITLDWVDADSRYADSSEQYLFAWNGTAWQFDDLVASATVVFTGYNQDDLVTFLDWSMTDPNYSVVSQGGPKREYLVVYVKHQIDHVGAWHHTSLVMELEDKDL